ncbi:MAG TPA: maleylpyruvate isomerase N-terminal domain-containing protein [Jatrophihabitans sp.]|jgi:uncharacterized protein (TIGR03083 family)|nr:maleylpyruvate isomerase N-terminal domain-containing protein [Jatrophihabitans sp.]
MTGQNPIPEDELAALLALDALPPDEQADAELRFGTFPAGLADVVATLADTTAAQPPTDLRARTMSRAVERRAAGRRSGRVEACTPAQAFDRTVGEFADFLATLSAADWATPAHDEHGAVRALVAHLVGVERLSVGWLDPNAPPPVDPHVDHVTATRPVVDELALADGPEVTRHWHAAARAVAAAAAMGDPARPVSFHDLETTVDGLLVIRTFELWAHWMDVALATGRPLPMLDASRMALLSATLMDFVPQALAYRGAVPRGTAQFVLLGEAGGTYTVRLDAQLPAPAPQEPDVTIIADAIGLCRLAARRLTPADLGAAVEGDVDLGAAILADLDALARD